MSVAIPHVLTDPGQLWIAPLGTADPTNTVAGGVFSVDPPVAWFPMGATTEGSSFKYSTTVEAIKVAEFFDPIKYATTERAGSIAFNLADYTLTHYQWAMNGGIAALTSTGATGSELTTFEPPDPGAEVRSMILWQSTDKTLRLLLRQCIQGGEVESAFKKAPDIAAIPCTFNLEIPTGAGKPFTFWAAGTTRV